MKTKNQNPNNYDYQKLSVLSTATMGVEYAPNPTLVKEKVYIADQLRLFFIINRMENADYNIGQESSMYGIQTFSCCRLML